MGDKDRLRGSLEVLEELNRRYKRGEIDKDGFLREIVHNYPSFAVLYTFYKDVILKKTHDFYTFFNRMRENEERVLELALKILKECRRIFTYSRSSQVLKVLKAKDNLDVVYITESRPNCEGITVARHLASRKIKVVLGIDMAAGNFINLSQCVLLGSDAILKNSFVNKLGTSLIVEKSLSLGKPVIVLSLPEKRLDSEFSKYFKIKNEPPEEVVGEEITGVSVFNRYFEEVPLNSKIKLII